MNSLQLDICTIYLTDRTAGHHVNSHLMSCTKEGLERILSKTLQNGPSILKCRKAKASLAYFLFSQFLSLYSIKSLVPIPDNTLVWAEKSWKQKICYIFNPPTTSRFVTVLWTMNIKFKGWFRKKLTNLINQIWASERQLFWTSSPCRFQKYINVNF